MASSRHRVSVPGRNQRKPSRGAVMSPSDPTRRQLRREAADVRASVRASLPKPRTTLFSLPLPVSLFPRAECNLVITSTGIATRRSSQRASSRLRISCLHTTSHTRLTQQLGRINLHRRRSGSRRLGSLHGQSTHRMTENFRLNRNRKQKLIFFSAL